MAQTRRDVFNLSKGPGQYIPDPREDEARAREASARGDRALNLQAQAQATQALQAQRQADLQQERMQTEAALAAQANGQFAQEMAARMRGGPAQQAPLPMGRDAINRQTNTLRSQQTKLGLDPLGRMDEQGGPSGVSVSTTGEGYGQNGMVRSPGVQQAGFDRASGLFGDTGDAGFQVAGRNLVAAEQKQKADIADALARTGILDFAAKSEDTHRTGTRREEGRHNLALESQVEDATRRNYNLQRDQNTESARHNQALERQAAMSMLQGQSSQHMQNERQTRADRLDVFQEAANQAALIFPESASGEISVEGMRKLRVLEEQDPDLAAAVAKIVMADSADQVGKFGGTPGWYQSLQDRAFSASPLGAGSPISLGGAMEAARQGVIQTGLIGEKDHPFNELQDWLFSKIRGTRGDNLDRANKLRGMGRRDPIPLTGDNPFQRELLRLAGGK